MVAFRNVALLHSHPRIALTHEYHIADLVKLCGLAAFIRDSVDDVWIPVTPNDRTPLATFEKHMRSRRPDLVGISSFTCSATSALQYAEIAKPEREQAPGSKNLGRIGKCVLRSSPMEGNSSCVFGRPDK